MIDGAALAVVLIVAAATYLYTRLFWSKRAALDFILKYEVHDPEWTESRARAILFLKGLSPDQCDDLACHWSDRALGTTDLEAMGHVFAWLNHLEVMAIAVLNRSLHRETYLLWMGEDLQEQWRVASPMVLALRQTNRGSDDLYLKYQTLAAPETLSGTSGTQA